ncbi:MAG TPA: NAD(P)/FAD-dependent oxidoreductase [Anaerolineaceae bacterium]
MRVAIIGAGVGGMAAAHDFLKAGHQVTIFESAENVGGLAAGFQEPHWNWSVEQYYHHWFTSDEDMFGLMREVGLYEGVVVRRPKTVSYYDGKFYPLDSPLAALTFPGYGFFDMVRFGLVTVYLRYLANWRGLEGATADTWLRRWYGPRVYDMLYEPLLQGKFGRHKAEVNMAWFWARIKARTTKLATYRGGFQAFCNLLAQNLRDRGAEIRLATAVRSILPGADGGVEIQVEGETERFDRVLVTVSPGLLARLAPTLPQDYLQGLLNLKSMGAVVLVVSLKNQLSKDGYYWFNIPKSAGFPFLALVEHTNFLSPEYFGGDHIVYCGDYLDPDHEYFRLSKEELLERFLPSFQRINPDFSPDWVKNVWLFRTPYAQPIPLVNHSKNIPAIQTPIAGLYFASMSQVYPWDRGTNFAVQIGRKAAREMLAG